MYGKQTLTWGQSGRTVQTQLNERQTSKKNDPQSQSKGHA